MFSVKLCISVVVEIRNLCGVLQIALERGVKIVKMKCSFVTSVGEKVQGFLELFLTHNKGFKSMEIKVADMPDGILMADCNVFCVKINIYCRELVTYS